MKYFYCTLLLLFISCKTYTSSHPEFSTFSENNQIEIKKVNNFRYLGGIKNTDGKILRDSLIYRSANLHQLRRSSYKQFEQLKIFKIIDLRTKQEADKEPDHLPKNISYSIFPAFEDKNDEMKNAKKLALTGKINANDANERMLRFYKDYVSENPHVIKKIITEILNTDQPVLYHCTAGKDRTGIITALILKILKFDNKLIFDEYLESNNLRKKVIDKRLNLANMLHFIYPKLDLGVIEKTSWIDRQYLQAAFDEIDTQYGSLDHYIHQVLGISENEREHYIQKFLK